MFHNMQILLIVLLFVREIFLSMLCCYVRPSKGSISFSNVQAQVVNHMYWYIQRRFMIYRLGNVRSQWPVTAPAHQKDINRCWFCRQISVMLEWSTRLFHQGPVPHWYLIGAPLLSFPRQHCKTFEIYQLQSPVKYRKALHVNNHRQITGKTFGVKYRHVFQQ